MDRIKRKKKSDDCSPGKQPSLKNSPEQQPLCISVQESIDLTVFEPIQQIEEPNAIKGMYKPILPNILYKKTSSVAKFQKCCILHSFKRITEVFTAVEC